MTSTEKWDRRFMEMARLVASWSKDPSSKVGAVITRGKFVVSVGFNGFPQGVVDSEERLTNRELKYPMILHAEINAITKGLDLPHHRPAGRARLHNLCDALHALPAVRGSDCTVGHCAHRLHPERQRKMG